MTDEVTTAAQEQDIAANQAQAGMVAATGQQEGGGPKGDPNAAPVAQVVEPPAPMPQAEPAHGLTVEEVEAKRNAENLARAKANGYVEPEEPSIAERVNALVESVEAAMAHNAPISLEILTEMKALLGHRG